MRRGRCERVPAGGAGGVADAVLRFVARWNTNSRHCRVAQRVLTMLLGARCPEALAKLPSMRASVEALLPYTGGRGNGRDRGRKKGGMGEVGRGAAKLPSMRASVEALLPYRWEWEERGRGGKGEKLICIGQRIAVR